MLLVASAVAGVIMLAEVSYFKPKRLAPASAGRTRDPILVGYARSFLPVILVVLVVRS